jgi:hypothetical protein
MKSKYRIKAWSVGCQGSPYYHIEIKRWYGWSILGDILTLQQASNALKELQTLEAMQ